MQIIDQIIRKSLHSDVLLVRQVSEYIINAGGKRLRPIITLLVARMLGYQGEDHYRLAAAVELIHTATLLHDDVVDQSSLRRGRYTSNAQFGNTASILTGDFIYSRAFQLIVRCQSMHIVEILANATHCIAEGEALQFMSIGKSDLDEASYLRMIQYKTAKLFEAAANIAAILCQASTTIEAKLLHYGRCLGTAFQIVDDCLDYAGKTEEVGKRTGGDLAEGKATLPLIYAMRDGTPTQKQTLKTALTQTNRALFPEVYDAIHATGALEAAYRLGVQNAQDAKAQLSSLPSNPYRDALCQLTELVVTRNH